jgi:PPP family 3-phenylpropionic acid transporter
LSPVLKPARAGRDPLPTARLVYFLYYTGFGIYLPFINIYYSQIGLSGLEIGLINTLSPLVGMLSAPLWGILNDRFGKTRVLLAIAVIGSILAGWGIAAAGTFLVLVPIAALFSLFYSTIQPMLDSNTLLLLGDQRERYGSIRLWGSAGYVLLTLAGGYFLERLGLHFLFPIFTMCMTALLISLMWFPTRRVVIGSTPRLFETLWSLLRQPRWMVFIISVMLLWISANGMHTFLGVYLADLGASQGLIGLTMAIGGAAEIPSMYFGSKLLKHLAPKKMIAIGMFAYMLRMLCYAVMPDPAWAPYINLLNSVTFGFFWIGSVAYVNDLAPDEIKATSQGLLLAVLNLAALISTTFAGWLYDTAGPSNLFFILGASSLTAFLIFSFGTIALRKKTSR